MSKTMQNKWTSQSGNTLLFSLLRVLLSVLLLGSVWLFLTREAAAAGVPVQFHAATAGGSVNDEEVAGLYNSTPGSAYAFDYTLDAPTAPFVLKSGSLTGHLEYGEQADDLIFGVNLPSWVPMKTSYTCHVGGTISFRNGTTKQVNGWLLEINVFPGPGSIDVTPSTLNFDSIEPRAKKTLHFTVTNHEYSPITISVNGGSAPFKLTEPGAHYVLDSGNGVDFSITCNPTNANFWESTVKGEVSVAASGYASIAVTLSAYVYGPKPVNFQKWQPISVTTEDPKASNFRMLVDVSFQSSTGVIEDIYPVRISELLWCSSGCQPSIYPPSQITRSLGCEGFPVAKLVDLPAPWASAPTADIPFPGTVNFLEYPGTGLQGDYLYIQDSHGLNDLEFPLKETLKGDDSSYTIDQEYVWTAPWHKNVWDPSDPQNSCLIVESGLHDTITRSIHKETIIGDPIMVGWYGIVESVLAGSKRFDLAVLPVDTGIDDVVDLERFSLGISGLDSGGNGTLSWPIRGGVIQTSRNVLGPWTDIPTADRTSIQWTNSSSGAFYRLAPLNQGAPILLSVPTDQVVTNAFELLVQAGGSFPRTIQWNFNGSPMLGETNAFLRVTNVSQAVEGTYYATVSNQYGVTNSPPAVIRVASP